MMPSTIAPRMNCVNLLDITLTPVNSGAGTATFQAAWLLNGGQKTDMDRLQDHHLQWMARLDAMELVDGHLLVHSDTTAYLDYGDSIEAVNDTVRETLTRTAQFYARPRDVDEVIKVVGLEEKADSRVLKLSGGQQRRLDVAYGIIGNPKLLFLDEPTTGFDPSARRGAWDLVNDLRGLGTTIMLTTHYMDEAQALADNIVVIGAGQLVAQGTPDSIGGRDTAALHVRFRLPDGVDPASLPLPVTIDHHGFCELTSTNDIKDLNTLTAWSLKQKVPLEGLVANRPSLEDTYLALVATAEDHS